MKPSKNYVVLAAVTCGSSFCNVESCKTQISMELGYSREFYLKSLRGNILQKSIRMFSLACNLLKMDAYSNDFEKIFLVKKNCDCNHIRSNQVAASVNALNHFHF